jgi:tyrocidine synthetase-3
LVAFVVPRTGALDPAMLDAVRAHALVHLPHYMVPHRFLWLERLPVTRNGKLDRRALLKQLDDTLMTASRAPASPLERETLAAWQTWLGTKDVGVDDNLFGRGADSLLFLRFVAHVKERYAVQLVVKDVFRCPSIGALCALIDERRQHLFNEVEALLDRIESLSDEEAERLLLLSKARAVDSSDF